MAESNKYPTDQSLNPQSRETGNLSDRPGRRGTAGRTGARTAGIGERNIHHVDCINVTMHRKRPGADRHASLNTHTGTAACGAGAGGTTAPGLPAGTAWLSHTQYASFFVLSFQDVQNQRATSISHQNKNPRRFSISPRGAADRGARYSLHPDGDGQRDLRPRGREERPLDGEEAAGVTLRPEAVTRAPGGEPLFS